MVEKQKKFTIKDLADELGVTKQTVRNYLKELSVNIDQLKVSGVVTINEDLASKIKEIYQSKSSAFSSKKSDDLPLENNETIKRSENNELEEFYFYQLKEKDKQIQALLGQLESKDIQLQNLNDRLKNQQELNLIAEKKVEQYRLEVAELTNIKNKKWWQIWK